MAKAKKEYPYFQVSLRKSDNAGALVRELVDLVCAEKGVAVDGTDAVLIAIKEAIEKRKAARA